MTALTNFFKESDSQLGVFYPKHYIIATFSSFDKALQAGLALRKAGFSEDEFVTIPGSETLKFFEEFREHAGLWAGVMAVLSRAFGTEQIFADHDIKRAQAGAGFLAVYSPEQQETERIHTLLEPFEPRTMHWYQAGCIQTLV
jgi:hypothetical protein